MLGCRCKECAPHVPFGVFRVCVFLNGAQTLCRQHIFVTLPGRMAMGWLQETCSATAGPIRFGEVRFGPQRVLSWRDVQRTSRCFSWEVRQTRSKNEDEPPEKNFGRFREQNVSLEICPGRFVDKCLFARRASPR